MNKVIRILGVVNDLMEKVAVSMAWVMLLAITALNIIQVFFRYCLNNALSWTEEASLWMLVWISFVILPVAYRKGLNISMMLFRDMLKRNRLEFFIRCLLHLVVLLISAVCLGLSYRMFMGGFRLEMPALEISKAWVYAIMPPAWFLMIIVVIEALVKDLRGIFDPVAARAAEDHVKSSLEVAQP